ncbi:HYC_CC_PP family protein [Sunxiuqinia sp. A32]|uniref:HYC_CC_PP family protein n=1 Tax=Sunxiuqinia sp. A32 TaxID=3461496 RepID=UPI0040460327
MTKRFIHITMTLMLIVASIGFTITKHYCGDELVDLSITGNVDSCCDMQDGCCHDESQAFHLNQDYTSPVVIDHVYYFTFVTFEIPQFCIERQEEINTTLSALNFGESPPPKDVLHFLSDVQVYRL